MPAYEEPPVLPGGSFFAYVPCTAFFGDNYLETGVKAYFIWRNAVRRTAQSINYDMNRFFLAALRARAIEAL